MPPGTILFRSAVGWPIGFFSRHSPLSSVSIFGHGRAVAIVHIPDKSGLPLALRGAGAVRSGFPLLSRGTPSVGSLIHWPDAPTHNRHASARKRMGSMLST